MEINRNVVLIAVIVLIGVYIIMRSEGFDASGQEFLPVGSQRYGLRGEPLSSHSARMNYLPCTSHIMLNHAGGMVYEAATSPLEQGKNGCVKTACPFDSLEFAGNMCWSCDNGDTAKIPYHAITPH